MKTRLRSQRVLVEGPDGVQITPATLVFTGSRITAVLPLEAPHPDDDDLGRQLLTPAFVDAHTHLALAFMRGVHARSVRANLVEDLYFHFESRLQPGDVRAFARMGAYESLSHGVGLVWDHYYAGAEVAHALRDSGLTGVVSPTLQDLAGPGKDDCERGLRDTFDIAENTAHEAHGVFAALGPHATDTVSPPLFRRVAELAEQKQLPVHLHVAQSLDELLRVEAREGRSPIALLQREGVLERAPQVLMAHAIYAPEFDLRSLDPKRHTLLYCPSSQAQFAMPASLSNFVRAGARWVVASDCASSNDSMNLQKELRACQLVAASQATYGHAYTAFLARGEPADAETAASARREGMAALSHVLTPESLFSRITRLPGALHPRFTAGTLAPGALANVLAWDTDHPAFFPARDCLRALALGDTTQAIVGMWTRGQEVGRRGDVARSLVQSDAYREAHGEARARLDLLLDRAP